MCSLQKTLKHSCTVHNDTNILYTHVAIRKFVETRTKFKEVKFFSFTPMRMKGQNICNTENYKQSLMSGIRNGELTQRSKDGALVVRGQCSARC